MSESILRRTASVCGRGPGGWRQVRPAVLAIAGLLATAPVARAADFAQVLRVVGPVEYRHARVWSPAKVGTELDPGDAIRTGDKAYATIRDRGAVTKLYPLTTLDITSDSQLSVTAGRIWSHFLHVLGLPREIRAPDAVAMIRGTTLSVGVSSAESNVTVLEGHVVVQALSGASAMVNGGFSVGVDHGMLGSVLQANPVLLDQGRAFLERALPLMKGMSAAPGRPLGRDEARNARRAPGEAPGMVRADRSGGPAPSGGAPVARASEALGGTDAARDTVGGPGQLRPPAGGASPGLAGQMPARPGIPGAGTTRPGAGPIGPHALQWHRPDAEQRSEAEWDAGRLGAMDLQRGSNPLVFRRAGPGRGMVGRRGFPAQNAPMGLFRTGPGPSMMGGPGPVGDLSVERMERPAGVVLPNGRPMARVPVQGGATSGLPGPVQATEPRDGATSPLTGTSPSQVEPVSSQGEHTESLPQGTGVRQTR